MPVRDTLRRALERSTIVGVSRASKEKQSSIKAFWFFAIIIFILLIAWSIIASLMDYGEYRTNTEIHERTPETWTTEFLLCNRDPFVKDPVPGVLGFEEYLARVNLTFKDAPDTVRKRMLGLRAYLQTIGGEKALQLGFGLGEMLLGCQVEQDGAMGETVPCTEVFTPNLVHHHKYITCYKFSTDQPIRSVHIKAKVAEPGPLTMQMLSSPPPGLVVALRTGESPDDSWDSEVVVPAGAETTVDVRSTLHYDLPTPYSDCAPASEEVPRDADIGVGVSCLDKCMDKMVQEQCQCTMLAWWKDTNENHCLRFNPDNPETNFNYLSCLERLPSPGDSCSCPPPCVQVTHGPLVSSSPWRRDQELAFYVKYLRRARERDLPDNVRANYENITSKLEAGEDVDYDLATTASSALSRQYLSVSLTFPKTQTVMTQVVAKTLASMGPEIGGLLNLAGISLVFFLEPIDLIIRLCLLGRKNGGEDDNAQKT